MRVFFVVFFLRFSYSLYKTVKTIQFREEFSLFRPQRQLTTNQCTGASWIFIVLTAALARLQFAQRGRLWHFWGDKLTAKGCRSTRAAALRAPWRRAFAGLPFGYGLAKG